MESNQFILYSEMRKANQWLSTLTYHFDQTASTIESLHGDINMLSDYMCSLKESSECTKYHIERIDKELTYMNKMNYLTGKNDISGFISNYPPT